MGQTQSLCPEGTASASILKPDRTSAVPHWPSRSQQRATGALCGPNPGTSTGGRLSTTCLSLGVNSQSLLSLPDRRCMRLFSKIGPRSLDSGAAGDGEPIYMDEVQFYMQAAGEFTPREQEPRLLDEQEGARETPVQDRFFNRLNEMEWIQDELDTEPGRVLLIVGPKNSGKTRLIAEIIARNESRVTHINCGLKVATSPANMAQLMHASIMNRPFMDRPNTWTWRRFLKLPAAASIASLDTLGKSLSGFNAKYASGVALAVGKLVKEKLFNEERAKLGDLAHIQESYEILLETLPNYGAPFEQKYPIIIIDEVNKLRQWQEDHSKELGNFLDFLQRISKERKKAHVVLLTSESSMVSWLAKEGMGDQVRQVMVLGDLSEEEAERLVRGGERKTESGNDEAWPGLISRSTTLTMNDTEWEKVYEACGGNIFNLSLCVKDVVNGNTWDQAITRILMEPTRSVQSALDDPETLISTGGVGPALWTKEHYKAVVARIVDNKYHAIKKKDALTALEGIPLAEGLKATVSQVLLSMVEWNVLCLRPYFHLAKDIPREAFGEAGVPDDELDEVVTMPSAPHLRAALKMKNRGIWD